MKCIKNRSPLSHVTCCFLHGLFGIIVAGAKIDICMKWSQKDFFCTFLGKCYSIYFLTSESAAKFTKVCSFNDVNKINSESMNQDCRKNKCNK